MIKNIKFIYLISLFILCNTLKAQILDDSTHLVYGIESTLYYTFDDVYKDSIIPQNIDSSFYDQHYKDGSYINGNYYQTIGNSVTPGISMWLNPEINIVQRLAADRFSQFREEKFKYYNTKSPYTFLKYIQGFQGDQLLSGMYTQNITSTWNTGFDFFRGVDKVQYAQNGTGDRLSETWRFRTFTSYYSKNNKYHLLANYETHNSHINEQWGIIFDDGNKNTGDLTSADIDTVLFNVLSTVANNTTAKSSQKYKQIDIFQKYDVLGENVGIYSKNKYLRDKRIYIDTDVERDIVTERGAIDTIIEGDTTYLIDTVSNTSLFYDTTFFSNDTTYDERLFNSFENELGVYFKGKKWSFTLGYLIQNYGYESNYTNNKVKWGNEQIITNELNIYPFKDFTIKSTNSVNLSGNYSTENTLLHDNFSFKYKNSLSKPYLTDEALISNHIRWKKSFKNIFSNEFEFMTNVSYKWLDFSSKTNYRLVNNYIYYSTDYNPKQHSKVINVFQSINRVHLSYKSIHFEQTLMYSNTSSDVIRVPKLILNSKTYFANKIFKKVLNSQLGVEMRWISSYDAYNYIPIIQNFGLQNDFDVYSYPVIDVFGNFQISVVDVFFKIGHTNQFLGRPGYFSTPYYPEKELNIAFGIKWRFFD